MPNKSLEEKFADSVTHQAVCKKGDFYGPHQTDLVAAETDAANHCSKPGKTNHVVRIITTTTVSTDFTPDSHS